MTGSTPTAALTRAIRDGSPEALSRLFHERFDWMMTYAHTTTRRDTAFCLDVVQEAWMRVIRSLPVLEHEAQLEAWLRRAVDSCYLDLVRREASRVRRERRRAPRLDASRPAAEEFDVDALASLRRQLAALSPAELDLLVGRFRWGWTLERLAAMTGLSVGAVDGRVTRLLARLRKELDDGTAR